MQSVNPNLLASGQHVTNQLVGDPSLLSDDMFLTLESEFCDDFDKIKRITTADGQPFCIGNDEFAEIITEVSLPTVTLAPATAGSGPGTGIQPQYVEITTNGSAAPTITTNGHGGAGGGGGTRKTKATKKYKRQSNNNNNNTNNANLANSNSNSNSSSNGSHTKNGTDSTLASGDATNGQAHPRKERSLHYCSICSKGFKDKYSVNVHHRTHTGMLH